ncbi:MAG: 5'-methylthioadenosine/S-adenosylhomocysteine nucleosidase [Fibrobacterota bacterium]
MKIGILLSQTQLSADIRRIMTSTRIDKIGLREYVCGSLSDHEVVLVCSNHGKAAAANAAAALFIRYGVDTIFFTGFCGAVTPHIAMGDLLIAERFIQYDVNVSALSGTRYEIPLQGFSSFPVHPEHAQQLTAAVRAFADQEDDRISVHTGCLGSADRFVCTNREHADLQNHTPTIDAVDMEGASVAHIGYEYNIPVFAVMLVSDRADETARRDYLSTTRRKKDHLSRLIPSIIRTL